MKLGEILARATAKPDLDLNPLEKNAVIIPNYHIRFNPRSHLRKCTYSGIKKNNSGFDKYYFHRWYQAGGDLQENGTVDVGAILEAEEGNIIAVWDIEEIKFEVEAI